MRFAVAVVAVFVLAAVVASPVLAHDWPSGPYHHGKHHRSHWDVGIRVAPIVAPAPVYAYPSYPPPFVYSPAPQVVVPAPVYAVPRPYPYTYPRSYIGYHGRGLSIGLGF
jgi:hypothetical protein